MFGGVVGTGLGFGVAYVISLVTPLPAVVEVWSVMLGISITAIVGLFFGLYPAMQAASPPTSLGKSVGWPRGDWSRT